MAVKSSSAGTAWLSAVLIWLVGGVCFPLLNLVTAFLSAGVQTYLSSATNMSEELAYRVVFTIFRVPLTGAVGIAIALVQRAMVPDVRPIARGWVIAAAIGGCISTLIFLPSSLVVLQVVGTLSDDGVRLLLLVPGAALFGALVSWLQQRTARGKVFTPGWFVPGSILAAALGALIAELTRLLL